MNITTNNDWTIDRLNIRLFDKDIFYIFVEKARARLLGDVGPLWPWKFTYVNPFPTTKPRFYCCFFVSELGIAALTSVRVSADPGVGAGAVSTTTWNARDTGDNTTDSLGLDRGPMIGMKTNGVRLAAIFGGVGVGGGLVGLWTPKASSIAVAGNGL